MQEKARRQRRILSLIRTRSLSTQQELVDLLEKSGFEATQSSVSRDLDELEVIKVRGAYAIPSSDDASIKSRWLLSLRPAGDSMLVGQCEPGLASAISAEIDRAEIPEIIGTIAGDDTLFIAVNGKRAQSSAQHAILDLFQTTPQQEIAP